MEQKSQGTPVFWLISQQARVQLMQLQWKRYGLKLDIPPRPQPPTPQIPVRIDMPPAELEKFISKAPEHQARVD